MKEIDLVINKRGFIYNSITDEREEKVSIPWTKVTLAIKTQKMYIFYTSVFSTLYMLKLKNKIDEDLTQIEQIIEQLLNEYYVPFKIL
ncbi:MAG: hypothetical protein L0J18_11570 [Tetragenococcus koreensis]|nr:hypothetical protein [Tetragenococcus koreensis]MDN6184514.1 hypothetical protein [Lactococcus lactis]MDN6750265.1 hypothetical protein [Staphylococcus equorum]MDN6836728.1 hypothetical protein [Lactococcus lactis]